MPSDRTLNTAEQAWIAKYRAALNEAPVPRRRFEGVAAFFQNAKKSIVEKVDKLFAKNSPTVALEVVATAAPAPVTRRTVRRVGQRSRKEPAEAVSPSKRRKRVSGLHTSA